MAVQAKYIPFARRFFARPAEVVARQLLGHTLVRLFDDGTVLAGRIVETEAYLGPEDPASHSARRKSEATRHIWESPGFAYVYLCMGMYHCLNVVAQPKGRAGCVLIRAVEPLAGIEEMRRRRPKARADRDLCSGPGKLCQALGITTTMNKADLTTGNLFIAKGPKSGLEIGVSPRIGISEAQDWPLRFYVLHNAHVSGAKRLSGFHVRKGNK